MDKCTFCAGGPAENHSAEEYEKYGSNRLAEDAAHVADIAVLKRRLPDRRGRERQAIIGLLVLAPADTTHETLVVQQDALPAKSKLRGIVNLVVEVQLVEVRALRVRHDRVLALVGAGSGPAVEIAQQLEQVIVLRKSGPTVPGPRPVIEAQARR